MLVAEGVCSMVALRCAAPQPPPVMNKSDESSKARYSLVWCMLLALAGLAFTAWLPGKARRGRGGWRLSDAASWTAMWRFEWFGFAPSTGYRAPVRCRLAAWRGRLSSRLVRVPSWSERSPRNQRLSKRVMPVLEGRSGKARHVHHHDSPMQGPVHVVDECEGEILVG